MTLPAYDGLYRIHPLRLHHTLSRLDPARTVAVRVLSKTDWTTDVYRNTLQEHLAHLLACPALPRTHTYGATPVIGRLVLFAWGTPPEQGCPLLAPLRDSVDRLRTFKRWEGRSFYPDGLRAVRAANLGIDIIDADDLTDPITPES